jgi:hypothetical protein
MGRSKAELQSFLDQPRQAGPLLRCQRFGIGKQGIVDIKSGLHEPTIQISVYYVNLQQLLDENPDRMLKFRNWHQAAIASCSYVAR